MTDKKFINEVIEAHNYYRNKHGVPPVKERKALTDYAQNWADHLAKANQFQHSKATLDGKRIGENIAMKWTSNPQEYTGRDVTDQWYSEIDRYDFEVGGTMSAGHFSQVVWKDSTEIGIGKAMTSDNKIIVVANYDPAGNFMGKYKDNVFMPTDGKIEVPKKKAAKGGSLQKDDKQTDGGPTGAAPGAHAKTVKRETITRTAPDGTKTITIRETYTNSDGSTKTVERIETKGPEKNVDMKKKK